MGVSTGDAITTGFDNVAIGRSALTTEDTGRKNVAIGSSALESQNADVDNLNTAVGFEAGKEVTTGVGNTVLGSSAGVAVTTGATNVCLGTQAGNTTTTGSNNVIIGKLSTASAADGNNQIVIGDTVAGSGNDNFTFGSGSTDSNVAFGATTITAPSDGRYKEEIIDATAGLSFINDLRPVTFKWKKEKDLPSDHIAYVEDSETRTMNDYTNHGFIAQEVKTAIDAHSEIKDGFEMWQADETDGRQRLGPSALVPILVKAIQEQQTTIEALTARMAALEA